MNPERRAAGHRRDVRLMTAEEIAHLYSLKANIDSIQQEISVAQHEFDRYIVGLYSIGVSQRDIGDKLFLTQSAVHQKILRYYARMAVSTNGSRQTP